MYQSVSLKLVLASAGILLSSACQPCSVSDACPAPDPTATESVPDPPPLPEEVVYADMAEGLEDFVAALENLLAASRGPETGLEVDLPADGTGDAHDGAEIAEGEEGR